MKPGVTTDLPEWPTWEGMNSYRDKAINSPYPDDSKTYLTVLMETGCRRSEAVTIKKEQVKWNKEAINITRVPVTKYRTAKIRDVLILRDEHNPWAEDLLDYVSGLDHMYLFPARRKKSRDIIPQKHTTGRTLYNRISELDSVLLFEDIENRDIMWPHGIRGLRASMLVAERDFTVQMLMKWFEWTHPGMAIHYTRTRDLAKAMGIRNIPR